MNQEKYLKEIKAWEVDTLTQIREVFGHVVSYEDWVKLIESSPLRED